MTVTVFCFLGFSLNATLLTEMTGSMMYVPDSNLVQDDDEPEPTGRSTSMSGAYQLGHDENPTPVQTSHVVITTTKVSCSSPSGTLLNTNSFLSPF
jgi:hypothetical protein